MKNPLVKQDHTFLIASVAVGAIASGAFAWLYLTNSGADARKEIAAKFKELAKEIASDFISKKTNISKKTIKAVADHFVKTK